MPQIDKVGFLGIVAVSIIFFFINLFITYLVAVLPHFSELRAHFDISKDSFIKVFLISLDKAVWALFIILL